MKKRLISTLLVADSMEISHPGSFYGGLTACGGSSDSKSTCSQGNADGIDRVCSKKKQQTQMRQKHQPGF